MNTKNYTVKLESTTRATFKVDARSEQEAIELCKDGQTLNGDFLTPIDAVAEEDKVIFCIENLVWKCGDSFRFANEKRTIICHDGTYNTINEQGQTQWNWMNSINDLMINYKNAVKIS